MELIAYWIVVLIAGILFLPNYEGGDFQNIPLFVIILLIALILTLIKVLHYVFFVLKIKKQLLKNGYTIKQISLAPNLRNSKCYHLSGEKEEKTVNIYIAKRKNSYFTYHFENENRAELYKHTRLAIKPSVRQANIISGHVETRSKGEVNFFWHEEDFKDNIKNILLFKKMPNNVTDICHQYSLGNGDKICDKVILCDMKGFERVINN